MRCYIGEADIVADRLRYHQRDKDFWDRVVVITSKDANLTKSHGRYLESKLISLAKLAARVVLENGTEPPVPGLPEADASDMDEFVGYLQIVLPVLGVNAIRVRETKPLVADPSAAAPSPVFQLVNTKLGADARAQQIDGEFTLLAGSKERFARARSTGRAPRRRTRLTVPSTSASSRTARSSWKPATARWCVTSSSRRPRLQAR